MGLSIALQGLPKVQGEYRYDYDISKNTWFKVGGKVDLLFKPKNLEDLQLFISEISQDIPVNIIGVGSNLLIRDGGIEGILIKLGRDFTNIKIENNKLIAGAGALSFNVAQYAAIHDIASLEFLVGIPGTIGGALAMNAGAYGNDTANILYAATIVDKEGAIRKLSKDEIGFKYRSNSLSKDCLFVEAEFNIMSGDKQEILDKMNNIMTERKDTQPIGTSTCGSTFKNPDKQSAWKLIDDVGMRGYNVGGAKFSEKHCNFIINYNNATASDIENLGEEARKRIYEKFGIMLEWEIKIIGRKL